MCVIGPGLQRFFIKNSLKQCTLMPGVRWGDADCAEVTQEDPAREVATVPSIVGVRKPARGRGEEGEY